MPKLTLDNSGNLPAYTWPGGYPIIYLDHECSVLCAQCATNSFKDEDERPEYKPVDSDIYYEGPTLQCEQCNADIESAYGDPDTDNQEEN